MHAHIPASAQAKPAPWYRHRWPWLIMLGPAAVVVAGVHTTWIAFTHQDALVSGDYYKQGKAINQDLRRDRAAAAMKLDFGLRFDPAAGQLRGNIGSHGVALPGEFILSLNHSTLPGKDIRLTVTADADGRFSVALPMLDMARWQVTVENPGRDWRLAGRWMWPQQTALRIIADTPVLPE